MTDLVLRQRSDREHRAGQVALVEHVHDVALVLGPVGAALERELAAAPADAGVMARRHGVEAELGRPLGQAGELDLAVALDTRIRRDPGAMCRDVRRDNVGLEVVAEVEHEVFDAEGVSGAAGVVDIRHAAATRVALPAPQAHRHADDVVAVGSEEGGGDGRIDPAAHRHHHLHCAGLLLRPTGGRRARSVEIAVARISTARSASASVVVRPSVIRSAPAAQFASTPMAARTCDGSIAPLAHAEAAEAHSPASSRR